MARRVRSAAGEVEEDMNLYETFYEPCTVINKSKVPDGEGGTVNTWTPGAAIDVAFQSLTPTQQIAAQQTGAQYTDTITTPAAVTLDEQDVFQRDKTGKYYRVLSVEQDTPRVATFKFHRYNVREMAALP